MPQLIPCPCGYVPDTREDLIAHMEAKHSGYPYLVSGYSEAETVIPPEKAIFYFELFIPNIGPPCRGYPFDYWYFVARIVSPLDYSDDRYITDLVGRYPWRDSGFHDAKLELPTDYEYYGYHLLPSGVYSLVTDCGWCGTSGIYTRCGKECSVWLEFNTRLTVTLGEGGFKGLEIASLERVQ